MKLLRQQANQTALTNRLKAMRKAAKIEYQPGFAAPPANKAS